MVNNKFWLVGILIILGMISVVSVSAFITINTPTNNTATSQYLNLNYSTNDTGIEYYNFTVQGKEYLITDTYSISGGSTGGYIFSECSTTGYALISNVTINKNRLLNSITIAKGYTAYYSYAYTAIYYLDGTSGSVGYVDYTNNPTSKNFQTINQAKPINYVEFYGCYSHSHGDMALSATYYYDNYVNPTTNYTTIDLFSPLNNLYYLNAGIQNITLSTYNSSRGLISTSSGKINVTSNALLNITASSVAGPINTINTNFTNKNNSVSINYNTTNGTISNIPIIRGNTYTLNSTLDTYSVNSIFTASTDTYQTYNQQVYFMNVTLYDEKLSAITLTAFNFSNPTRIEQTLYCENYSITTNISNTTTGSILLNPPCIITELKYTLYYLNIDGTTTIYDRTIITADASFTGNINLRMYIPDLKRSVLYTTGLKPYDIFGVYTVDGLTRVQVYKMMPTGTELMSSDYIDAQGLSQVYLIQNDQYILNVYSLTAPLRVLGPYTATSEGIKILRLFDVVLTSGATTIQGQIYADTSIDTSLAASMNTSILHMLYYDPTNSTTSLNLMLFNGSCNATTGLLFDQTYNSATLNNTESTVYFSYNIVGTPYNNGTSNKKFCSVYTYVTAGVAYTFSETSIYDQYIPKPKFKSPWTLQWIIFLFLLVIALSLNARTVSFGSLFLVALAAILYSWNWISTGAVPGVRMVAVYGICILIAIILNIKRQM